MSGPLCNRKQFGAKKNFIGMVLVQYLMYIGDELALNDIDPDY